MREFLFVGELVRCEKYARDLERKKGVSDGDDLLSHTVAHAVPSAQTSLTAVFGMGTGVASLL